MLLDKYYLIEVNVMVSAKKRAIGKALGNKMKKAAKSCKKRKTGSYKTCITTWFKNH